jgi:hypothetical protein
MKHLLLLTFIICIGSNDSLAQNSSSAVRKGADATNFELPDTTNRLDEVEVSAKAYPQTQLVGPYKQPAWTLVRKFPATRVYLMVPPGSNMYEKWVDMRVPKKGPAEVRFRDEFAFGLGKRIELDLYLHTVLKGQQGEYAFDWRGFSWEVRYALADWGKIWGNPTLYFEHKILNGFMGIEPKILLGDQIGKRSIWGLNLIYEAFLAKKRADQEREWASTGSYGYMVNDDFTAGLSLMYRYNDIDFSDEFYAGPLIQYRFNSKAYISIETLLGTTETSKSSRNTLIFGWRF